MKLPSTEKYIAGGIKLYKVVNKGGHGLFWSQPDTYSHVTVYDLEEALELNQNGWYFENYDDTFHNLALRMWRDLKDYEPKKTKKL